MILGGVPLPARRGADSGDPLEQVGREAEEDDARCGHELPHQRIEPGGPFCSPITEQRFDRRHRDNTRGRIRSAAWLGKIALPTLEDGHDLGRPAEVGQDPEVSNPTPSRWCGGVRGVSHRLLGQPEGFVPVASQECDVGEERPGMWRYPTAPAVSRWLRADASSSARSGRSASDVPDDRPP